MQLFSFEIDFEDFNLREQLEISRDADELCCKAIEDIIGINRMSFKRATQSDSNIVYTWRNVYIFSLHSIFNVPIHIISKMNNMPSPTISNIVKKVGDSKNKDIIDRVKRIHTYININY